MSRLVLLAALAVSLAAGCKLDPEGRCDTRADCAAGLDCLNGVCAACRSDGDCAAWQACGAGGLCAPLAGRCDGAADCRSWETCDPGHACVLSADRCPNVTCGTLQSCDPAHRCTLVPGACNVDGDCPPWMAGCDGAANACLFSGTAGDDVLAFGTLVEGSCGSGAVSRASTAGASTGVEVGFACGAGSDRKGYLDPANGTVVYRLGGDVGGDTLRRFHPDAMTWDAAALAWRYPGAPAEDDPIVADTSPCPTTWDRWLLRGGDGAILYGCPVANGSLWDFYDATAARRFAGIAAALSWTGDDCVLLRTADGRLQVSGSAPCAAGPVTLLPDGAPYAFRTTPAAFRVALHDDGTGEDELWEIDESTGIATIVDTYVDVPGGYTGVTWEALDAAGWLYGRASFGSSDVILRRPLATGATSEIYSEAAMPAGSNDFGAATFRPFLRLDGSFLLTRP